MPDTPIRLVVDENIPFAEDAFHALGEVRLLPGASITRETVEEADALVVRSVTCVDRELLGKTPVRFVGTATAGTDHVDQEALADLGVAFASAPGSNAESVVEYVTSALFAAAVDRTDHRLAGSLRGKTAAVVGCGQVGGHLLPRLRALGMRTLAVDPPLARSGDSGESFVPLEEALTQADVVTLHAPLTTGGPDATLGLIDADALAQMQPGAVLVNAARGRIVDGPALFAALQSGHLGAAVLDVWPNEPTPDPSLIRSVLIGTPHIAGYSFDGKVDGTAQIARALADWLGRPEAAWDPEAALGGDPLRLDPPDPRLTETEYLDALARQLYDLRADDARFRPLADLAPGPRAEAFRQLRKAYPQRRAFGRSVIPRAAVPVVYQGAVFGGLGVSPA
jgi:erythronate-4-phosphate dehydrogenase